VLDKQDIDYLDSHLQDHQENMALSYQELEEKISEAQKSWRRRRMHV
jgi:hypothetical protein